MPSVPARADQSRSRRLMVKTWAPPRRNRINARMATATVVRVCVMTKGEISGSPGKTLPLKMALLSVAAAPQHKVAAAIKK